MQVVEINALILWHMCYKMAPMLGIFPTLVVLLAQARTHSDKLRAELQLAAEEVVTHPQHQGFGTKKASPPGEPFSAPLIWYKKASRVEIRA